MSSEIKIDLQDKYRALLTEVLPYELPIWFHNYNFYTLVSKGKFNFYRNASGLEKFSFCIPLGYNISRGVGASSRELSIIHPLVQLEVCDFYNDFDELIKFYCGRSKHSLRYPYRKARRFHSKSEFESKNNIGLEVDGFESITASSYFRYKKYAFLYKFFESYEYHQLEKRFSYTLQVDISKCFPSIYTHSISWAVKSKRLAKKQTQNNKGSFDGEFDRIMQNANYKETNGIVIGPEISRIFAEIILQKIDIEVDELMLAEGFQLGKEYQFRRYVDDYFLFFNSSQVKKTFFKILEKSLVFYKLHLNESKTREFKRPFITPITQAKYEIRKEISNLYSSRYSTNELSERDLKSIRLCNQPSRESNRIISQLKHSFSAYEVSYTSVSNYLLSSIEKKIVSYIKKLKEIELSDDVLGYINWLLVDIDVLFFVHAMDIRVRPTDIVARLVVYIIDEIKFLRDDFKSLIFQKIFDQVRQAIEIVSSNSDGINGVETLNLLMILTKLPDEYLLPSEIVREYFTSLKIKPKNNKLETGEYFLWITFMIYIRDRDVYSDFKDDLITLAVNFMNNHPDGFVSTEMFTFYFDFLACPYIKQAVKESLYLNLKEKYSITVSKENMKALYKQDFIVSWQDSDFLKNSLNKKQFVFPYK